MASTLKPVSPGDTLSADQFNTVIDAARAIFNVAGGFQTTMNMSPAGLTIGHRGKELGLHEPAIVAEVLNVGVSDLAVFHACMLTYPIQNQSPPIHWGQPLVYPFFVGDRVLEGQLPTEYFFGRLGIAAEYITVGKIGKVWVHGVCPAWILRPTDQFSREVDYLKADRCDTAENQYYLQASACGAAQILWVPDPLNQPDPPAAKFGVIRIDHRNTSGVGMQQRFYPANRGVCEVLHFPSHAVTRLHEGVVEVLL